MITTISCGEFGSTDCATFSPCGNYLAVVGAPDSTLYIKPLRKRRLWDRLQDWRYTPQARNVSNVLLRSVGDDVELLYSTRRSGLIERYLLNARRRLPALRMPGGYDLLSLVQTGPAYVDSDWGPMVAAGDSYGNICVWSLGGDMPQVVYNKRPLESSVNSLAFSRAGMLYATNSCSNQFIVDLGDGSSEKLNNASVKWGCYTVAASDAHDGAAMGGDGNRIWLVNMPFKLDPAERYSAGDGFPLSGWEMDASPGIGDRYALQKRIFLPCADADKCAFIDSDSGACIAQLYLTGPRELVVVGDHGLEVWNLSPLALMHAQGHRNSPSRRIFAACRANGRLLIARET